MNCKQGDMALVIRSNFNNEGKVVTCLESFKGPGEFMVNGLRYRLPGGDWWRVEPDLIVVGYGREWLSPFIWDSFLMPINGEENETATGFVSHPLVQPVVV